MQVIFSGFDSIYLNQVAKYTNEKKAIYSNFLIFIKNQHFTLVLKLLRQTIAAFPSHIFLYIQFISPNVFEFTQGI